MRKVERPSLVFGCVKSGAAAQLLRSRGTPLNERKTYNDIFMGCPDMLKKALIPAGENYYSYPDTKPVFFGHYWFSGEPGISNPNAICLDYSIAKGGKLVACRLDKDEAGLNLALVY